MKFQWFVTVLAVASTVMAWSAQDREIFALNDAVQKDIGSDKTFYNWLGVDRSASDSQIAKAYRKLSQRLHPDKNPSKEATDRFARLGLVVKVLRSGGRDRYDFFLKYGFPRWKGTDYYYSRYRPGLGTVLTFLYVLIATAQYWFMKLTASQHRNHMTSVIEEAKSMAWNGGLPTTQRKVTLQNGKLFMVYPGGRVTLIDSEDNNREYELDLSEIQDPTWRDTIVYKLPMLIYHKVTGTKPKQKEPASHVVEEPADATKPESKKKSKPKPAQKVGAARRRK